MNKTGTSSMKICFQALNLTPIAAPLEFTPETKDIIYRFYDDKDYAPILKLAESYMSFEDRPWNMWEVYQHLNERFPDSLFILTERDSESWWSSTERWVTVKKPHKLALYMHHLEVQDPSKTSMVDAYLKYNREVKAYFNKTNKLLVMDFEKGDGWEKLCSFLALPVPAVKFPHVNRQNYKKSKLIATLIYFTFYCYQFLMMSLTKAPDAVKSVSAQFPVVLAPA